MKEQTRVAEWMKKFGQEVPSHVVVPSLEVRKLRARLILEEALETIAGLGIDINVKSSATKNNIWLSKSGYELHESVLGHSLIEIADGIADSLVVQLGTAVACGIDIEPVFEEVMRSNDSKLWNLVDLRVLQQEGASIGIHKETGERYTVKCVDPIKLLYLVKDDKGKIIKPQSYTPANIIL